MLPNLFITLTNLTSSYDISIVFCFKQNFIEACLPGVVRVLFLLDCDHSKDGVGVLVIEGEVRDPVMLKVQNGKN
jgi:hypothetical protein